MKVESGPAQWTKISDMNSVKDDSNSLLFSFTVFPAIAVVKKSGISFIFKVMVNNFTTIIQ